VDVCQAWKAMAHPAAGKRRYLTVLLLIRIYAADKARLTAYELYQWLAYLSYAGVDHVYVYDAYERPEEGLSGVVQPWVDEGFATYVDWSAHTPYT
jgi:hypothetical protein